MVCRALSASEGCGLVVVIGVWFVVCVWLGGCGCPLGLVACVCGCSCFCVFVFVCLFSLCVFCLPSLWLVWVPLFECVLRFRFCCVFLCGFLCFNGFPFAVLKTGGRLLH